MTKFHYFFTICQNHFLGGLAIQRLISIIFYFDLKNVKKKYQLDHGNVWNVSLSQWSLGDYCKHSANDRHM